MASKRVMSKDAPSSGTVSVDVLMMPTRPVENPARTVSGVAGVLSLYGPVYSFPTGASVSTEDGEVFGVDAYRLRLHVKESKTAEALIGIKQYQSLVLQDWVVVAEVAPVSIFLFGFPEPDGARAGKKKAA